MVTLVTGATGFVGSAVAIRLIEAGHRVRALVRPGSDTSNIDGLDVDVRPGDITDAGTVERALAGCEALFHVAADYRLWVPDPGAMKRVNVEGTGVVMRAALSAGVGRVVYTSSVATLGPSQDGGPVDETSRATIGEMVGWYKRTKFLAEELVRRMVEQEGLPAVIVSPSTPVGPRDIKPTPTGRMIVNAVDGRMPAYVDTGLNIVHVDDVAAGHLAALERGEVGQRYILGGENLALREILDAVAALAGVRPPKVRLPHGLVLPLAYVAEAWAGLRSGPEPQVTVDGVRMSKKPMYYSSARAERALGYAARPAIEALEDAVDWFRREGYCR